MTKQVWEISASSWFYYKEICYDARSHERKMLMEVSYAQYGSSWRNPTEAFGLFDPVLNAVATDRSVKTSILVQVIAEEGKVDGHSEGISEISASSWFYYKETSISMFRGM